MVDRRRRLRLALAASLWLAATGGALAADTDAIPTETASPTPTPEATPTETPAPTPKSTPAPPENLEPIPADEAFSILGKGVRGPANEDMGRVVDLLFDRDARPRAVVIDFGGFLGVGSRRIAIDWQLLHFGPVVKGTPLQLSLGKTDIQAAPEYKDSAQPPTMVGPPPELATPTPESSPTTGSTPERTPSATPSPAPTDAGR